MSNLLNEVLEYNTEVKQFLTDLWAQIPKGRQKQYMKDARKKALIDRYGIEYDGK